MGGLQATMTVPTEDTAEAVRVPVLLDYHLNTGWDWMDAVSDAGWHTLANWGEDGYDLGTWPYVIVAARYARDQHGQLYGFALYVEGDVSTRWYRGRDAYFDAITAEAFFYWQLGQSDGPKPLPATAAGLHMRYRRPYNWIGYPLPEGGDEGNGR